MDIWVCDCCGKQIDRFVRSNKYDIRKSCKDHEGRAYYLRSLNFCIECQYVIEEMLNKKLGNMPEKVEVMLYQDE